MTVWKENAKVQTPNVISQSLSKTSYAQIDVSKVRFLLEWITVHQTMEEEFPPPLLFTWGKRTIFSRKGMCVLFGQHWRREPLWSIKCYLPLKIIICNVKELCCIHLEEFPDCILVEKCFIIDFDRTKHSLPSKWVVSRPKHFQVTQSDDPATTNRDCAMFC